MHAYTDRVHKIMYLYVYMLQYEGGESVTHDRTCNGKRHYDHQLNKGTILPLSHLEPYIKVKRLSAGMHV